MDEPTGHYVEVEGTRTYYEEIGEGPPVICLHPVGANSLIFRQLLPELADRGYRAIAVDLPGHSHSYPVDWEPMNTAHDIAEWAWCFSQEVTNKQPAFLGNALGGVTVLDLAVHHSNKCRAIVAFSGIVKTPNTGDLEWARHPSGCPSWQDRMERLAIDGLSNPDADLIAEMRWIHRGTGQRAAVADDEAWLSHDITGQLHKVDCPVLVAVGEDDYYVPEELIEQTRHELPDDCECQVLPDIGHYPVIENPSRAAKIASQFISTSI